MAGPGRVPFEGDVELTEILSVQDRDHNPIAPQSVTITPQFGEKTPIDASAGGKISLPVDTCSGKGLSSVSGETPYWSAYLVEAVYPYEKFVAQFYDEKQDKLTVSNTAKSRTDSRVALRTATRQRPVSMPGR